MARLILQSYKAEPASAANCSPTVIFDFSDPFPKRTVNVATAAEAAQALDAYAAEAKATGAPLCLGMMLARGERAPRGFKALASERFVNV